MLIRSDPFRDLDRVSRQFFGTPAGRTVTTPMDAYRSGEEFVVQLDLPGVSPESIDVHVEQHVLTVKAQRPAPAEGVEYRISERPRGGFTRRLFLGDNLDTDRIEAGYDAGVLTLRIPVAQRAKARKITVGATRQQLDA